MHIRLWGLLKCLITSPAGAVAKYCDEYARVYVCLSVCPRVYLRNHTRDLYQFLCMLPMAVCRSSSGVVAIRYMYFIFVDDIMIFIMGRIAV